METIGGQLQGWWNQKHEASPPSIPFDQRTVGDLLREYYFDAASELSRLQDRQRGEGHNAENEARIIELERIFSGEDHTDLKDMDAEQSEENWLIPRRTGDPLVDKWEAAIARGETPDLDE